MELGPLSIIIAIVSLPLQLLQEVMFGVGNFIVFDVLRLGPFLPITL